MNKKILRSTISDVLSEMCFLNETAEPTSFDENYKYVAFVEEPEFDLKIYYSEPIAIEVTENFLGTDDAPTEEEIIDALKELLNMILGKFVAERYQNHKQLLPIPNCTPIKKQPELEKENAFIIFYDDNPLKVYYRIKKW